MDNSKPALSCQPKNLSNEALGLLILAFSAFLFSCMGVLLKLSSRTGIPATQLVFTRALFQGAVVFIIMCLQRYDDNGVAPSNLPHIENQALTSVSKGPRFIQAPFGRTSKVINVVIMRGFFGAFGFVFYFYSMIALPLGDAVTLFSLYPIFTLLLARILLGEKIDLSKIIAALASVTGACLIAGPTFLSKSEMVSMDINPIGYVTAILGSLFGATVLVFVRKAGKAGAHTFNLLFSWCVFGITLSFLVGTNDTIARHLLKEGAWRWEFTDPTWWLYIAPMCTVGTFAHFCLNFAGRLAPAGLASITRSSDIVWAYLWEVLVFGQQPTWTTWSGVFFVICSLAVIALVQANQTSQSRQLNQSDLNSQIKEQYLNDDGEEKKEEEEYSALLSKNNLTKGHYESI